MDAPSGTVDLSSGEMDAVAGQVMIVYASLPADFVALRPKLVEIEDAKNWAITQFHIGDVDQLERNGRSVIPADQLEAHLGARGCTTIQTRMQFSMSVVYQGQGRAKFRCRLTGDCAMTGGAA